MMPGAMTHARNFIAKCPSSPPPLCPCRHPPAISVDDTSLIPDVYKIMQYPPDASSKSVVARERAQPIRMWNQTWICALRGITALPHSGFVCQAGHARVFVFRYPETAVSSGEQTLSQLLYSNLESTLFPCSEPSSLVRRIIEALGIVELHKRSTKTKDARARVNIYSALEWSKSRVSAKRFRL